jgi:hypothetical protein
MRLGGPIKRGDTGIIVNDSWKTIGNFDWQRSQKDEATRVLQLQLKIGDLA